MLSSLIFAALAVWVLYRLEPMLNRKLTVAEREVAVHEKQLEINDTEVKKPGPPPPPPIPADLLTSAMSQSELWAQEQKLQAMYELYTQVGDWDKVRHVMTVRGQF